MNSFIKIFPNPTFVDVLLFFLLHPREEIYQAALVQATKGTLMQVQRALQRIEAARLITKIKRGNRAYYRANEKHPAFEDLKQAFMKTIVFSDLFTKALRPLKKMILYGFIYGSVARGDETQLSDV
ncbi:MAG TPA: hypothetical protein VN457_05320, partial [Chlamydiales bacterium]|nr:hypothetical protein [Chlamydiales bacterium]